VKIHYGKAAVRCYRVAARGALFAVELALDVGGDRLRSAWTDGDNTAVVAALRDATGRAPNRVPVRPDDLAGLAPPAASPGPPPAPDVSGPAPMPRVSGLGPRHPAWPSALGGEPS